ncbi:MAG TPA: glycosyltransferase [Bryobacteraceae bacterium]|nr:glycosyltransferase [Bryobacteraceae bacterium]
MPDRLRVALIAGVLGRGGAEKQLLASAKALVSSGCEVELFTLTAGGCYADAFSALGIVPRCVGRSGFRLRRISTLTHQLRRFRPHVVHSGHGYANLYAGCAGRAVSSLVIGSLRGSYSGSLREYGPWSRILFRLPHALVTNSQQAYEDVLRHGAVRKDRLYLLPNAIEVPPHEPLRAARPRRNEIRAIFVGRLVSGKRLDRFLAALAIARKSDRRIRGVIAGDGPEMNAARRMASELDLVAGNAVTFLGACDHIQHQLDAADFLVFTSEDEGLPNAVLEAMASGLPVITTAAGDAARVVTHGTSGFVVEDGAPDRIAQYMVRLAGCPDTTALMGMAGRRAVAADYSAELLPRRLLGIYGDLAFRRRADRVLQLVRSLELSTALSPKAA